MSERSMKRILVALIGLCLLLSAALANVLLRHSVHPSVPADPDPVVARGPAANTKAALAVPHDSDPAEAELASVQLSPQRLQEIGVVSTPVEIKAVRENLQVPGNVAVDEQQIAYVQTRFPGWIRNVYANATYQYVKKGQRLFTIYSPDLVSTEQEYLLARQNQATSVEHMHGMPANESNWLLQAAEERIRRFNVADAEIARLEQSGTAEHEVAIDSPVSGYITERNALPNAYVQPDTKLYTITDLSTVWIYANVSQNNLGRLKPGDPAQVTVDAYPDRKFDGRIEQILPEVDTATRTGKVRLIFRNTGLALKPGMFVSVNIAIPMGRQIIIPATGVLQAGPRQIAFIDQGQGKLEPREIETGPRVDDSIVILKGLKPGERIVSSANFLLDSEAQLQSSIGQFTPSVQASSANPVAANIRVSLTTEPNPPRKGENTIRVRVSDSAGNPVDGAQVNATLSMAAMPAMGMAAMHATATLAGQGHGLYQGEVHLDTGGTWMVTITASKNGNVLTTWQSSLNATGAM